MQTFKTIPFESNGQNVKEWLRCKIVIYTIYTWYIIYNLKLFCDTNTCFSVPCHVHFKQKLNGIKT